MDKKSNFQGEEKNILNPAGQPAGDSRGRAKIF